MLLLSNAHIFELYVRRILCALELNLVRAELKVLLLEHSLDGDSILECYPHVLGRAEFLQVSFLILHFSHLLLDLLDLVEFCGFQRIASLLEHLD